MSPESGAVLAIVAYTVWNIFWYGVIGNLAHAYRLKKWRETFQAPDEA